jgi:hypothetical protein
MTRYDVEVFPTFDTIEPGHRLRITVATSDFPHALPDAAEGAQMTGGVYQLQRSSAEPSSVELPLGDPLSFRAGQPAAARCVTRRRLLLALPRRHGARVVAVEVFVNGHRRLLRRGRALRRVVIGSLPAGTFIVRIVSLQSDGRRTAITRVYRGCA